MKIYTGVQVLYLRQLDRPCRPGLGLDPTMSHVPDVYQAVKEHAVNLPDINMPGGSAIDWLDRWTCRISLPPGWRFK